MIICLYIDLASNHMSDSEQLVTNVRSLPNVVGVYDATSANNLGDPRSCLTLEDIEITLENK